MFLCYNNHVHVPNSIITFLHLPGARNYSRVLLKYNIVSPRLFTDNIVHAYNYIVWEVMKDVML